MAKTLKIVGLDGMKCQWVAEQDFLLKFSGQFIDTFFFCFLFLQPVWLIRAHLGIVWKISSPGTSWMSKLSRTVKTIMTLQGQQEIRRQAVTGGSSLGYSASILFSGNF